ncbi:Uncharacterised protein [Candidatus Anstonella stagnisolia]|nr:Uncharacterised protein [Candidatus Anstonella stagnisolia]
MQFTTIITILIAALLLFGCTAQKAEEKTKVTAKNETAGAENPAKNATAANEPKNSSSEMTAENKTTADAINPASNATAANISASGIPVAYFYSAICPFCKNATIYVEMLEKKYPISVQKYEIYYNLTNFNLFKQYVAEYRLKPDEFAVPTVFINTSYYGGPNIYTGLENKIQNLTKETKK